MKWRPTTAFLTGACVVLVFVVATYFLERFAQFKAGSSRHAMLTSTNQPTIQRPPHRVQLTSPRKSQTRAPSELVADGSTKGAATTQSPREDLGATASLAPAFRGGSKAVMPMEETGFGTEGAFVGGTITGRVKLIGTPPPEKTIVMTTDANCAALHSTPVTTRHYVVGTNGGLANVFVYVKEGLGNLAFPSPQNPVVLDQRGCLYEPYVFGVQVDQPLEIRNSDPTMHDVHTIPTLNPELNKGQPLQGMKFTTRFTKPEIMVKFKCDVHPWMFAYCNVVAHPFFDTSRTNGFFRLRGLPPGTYVIEAVHPKAGTMVQTVDVTTNRVAPLLFEFQVK